MAQRPPRDIDWISDDSTGITVPSPTKQNAGWLVEKPARQFFNWMWNRLSRWTHYFSGQSQEFIVIDSTNANEKDYDTLAAYIADSPAGGDKVLVKETQALTAQMIIPAGITLRLLNGVNFTRSTNEANSVIKFGSDIIIEGILNLVLSHTGTIAKALEFDGDNVVGKINVENSSTGTLTVGYEVNAAKTGNRIEGFIDNTGGGILTDINVDKSAELSNLIEIVDGVNNIIKQSLAFRNRIIETKNITSAVQTVTFSDLDGDRDIEYTIKGRIVNGGPSVSQMSMRFNSDSGANYALQETTGQTANVTAQRLTSQNEISLGQPLDLPATPGLNTYEITIFAKSGELRICGILIYEASQIIASLSTIHATGVWGNSGSNLISIEISSDQVNGIGVGSYLELSAK